MKKRIHHNGFTLLELLVVMVIIACMLTVTIPFAGRSGKALRLKQEAQTLVMTVYFGMDCVNTESVPVRLVFNKVKRTYRIEKKVGADTDFKAMEGYPGQVHQLSKNVRFWDLVNLEVDGNEEGLVFDPAKPWPMDVQIAMTDEMMIDTVKITGLQVDQTETPYQEKKKSDQ